MKMKKIILDLDATLTIDTECDYEDKPVNKKVLDACVYYKKMGFYIVINTSRNMKTFSGNIGKINFETLPKIITWLEKNNVPFDEIYVGKPWCGKDGFYVDDRSIRPSEFASLSYSEILDLLDSEKKINIEEVYK